MRTPAVRPLCAPAASGNCSVGTTARRAPGCAALNTVEPMPSTKATQGSTQKGMPPNTRLIARPAIAAARRASAPIINARRFQRSAAKPAGMARMATGAVRAKETRPAFTAEWVRASARSG